MDDEELPTLGVPSGASRRWAIEGLLAAVALFGAVAAAVGVPLLWSADASLREHVAVLACAFAAISPWSLRLPSGAAWRPAVALATAGMFLVPPPLLPLVVLPGLVLVTARSRAAWWKYPLTVGHVSAGLEIGAVLYAWVAPAGPPRLPGALPGMALALIVHFAVNRLLSAAILAGGTGRPLATQVRASMPDIHWGYLGIYVIGPTAALLYTDQGLWGLGLAAALLAALYKTAAYYEEFREWQRTAMTDGLTGAGNRSAWETFVRSLRGRPFSGTLLMIDMDGFKSVNDGFGHAAGDALLRELADAFAERARQDRLFRYGGDEFILFAGHEGNGVLEVRRRICNTLTDLNRSWRQRGYPVQASYGIATGPEDGQTIESLLALADRRMYAAKTAHKVRSHHGA